MTVTAHEWAMALLDESIRAGLDGRGRVAKGVARSLGVAVWRPGDPHAPDVPIGDTVRDPFGDGVDYAQCVQCGTHWPVNYSRSPFEWTHGSDDRDTIRTAIRTIGRAMDVDEWATDRALEWADRYYVDGHVSAGCNACQ